MDLDIIKRWITTLFNPTGSERREKLSRIALFLGILGMFLIGLSECGKDAPPANEVRSTDSYAARSTAESLEQQLLRILEHMDGVGEVKIMITMEDSGESYYATEDKTDGSSESIFGSNGDLNSIQNHSSTEQEYLLVENSSGRKEALLLSRSEPQVKGVIVICDGADNAVVRSAVTEAVCTVLHISSNRVYVAKAKAK